MGLNPGYLLKSFLLYLASTSRTGSGVICINYNHRHRSCRSFGFQSIFIANFTKYFATNTLSIKRIQFEMARNTIKATLMVNISIKSHHFSRKNSSFKGQLISKCPFGVIVWTKIPTKNLTNFCPSI